MEWAFADTSPDRLTMAAHLVPHIANDQGAEKVLVGVKELQCMGARAPFDHPHVFLDMGGDTQILCPYCSTLYVHEPRLHADETDPKGCLVSVV
jgi:uncharacterized Zn-finger protein